MARLNAIDPNQAEGSAKELLRTVETRLGLVPNMVRTMANSPAALEGYLSLSSALSTGRLSGRLREQIALAVAQVNACDYCLASHTAFGKLEKLTEAEIIASRRHTASDSPTAAALEFAVALVEGRGTVSDSAFARVRQAGFSDSEIAEIIANVALNIFTNYFNKASDVVVDFPRVGIAA
jgi:uncharacterized peroxidase-related enzyme